MTVWPSRVAAAIALGIALSPVASAAPSVAVASQPAPVTVAMVAALAAPERTTGLIDAETLSDYTSEFGVLTRALDEVIDRPIALGIDPSILASIRILGSGAPPSATAWLARLAAATNETFPLAWADADLTLGLQAGSSVLLEPESLDFAIDPSLFAPATEEPTATPTPTPTPTETPPPDDGALPPLPTSESLVAWNYTIPSLAWPALNSVAKRDLGLLAKSYDATILSSSNVEGAGRTARAEIGEASILINDDAFSTMFAATVDARTATEWNAAVAGFVSSLSAVPSTVAEPTSLLLALDRTTELSDTDLAPTIDRLTGAANLRTTTLAELLASDPVSVSLSERSHTEEAVTGIKKLLKAEKADDAFATIAADPTLITSERRLDLLATLSNAWRGDAVGWDVAQNGYWENSLVLRDSVQIVKSSSITLWADRASLPVTVSNGLDQAVTVFVTVRPQTPLLKVENGFVEVTVEPNSQRKAQVPVQSLSNGTVALDVGLHAPDGAGIGVPRLVRITVQAGWETPFTIGLAIVLVAVFTVGITRTILRRRRARASEG